MVDNSFDIIIIGAGQAGLAMSRCLSDLGIERAHFAACMPRDWQGLVANHPEVVASLTLICPMGINARLLAASSVPVLCITGDQGRQAQDAQRHDRVLDPRL